MLSRCNAVLLAAAVTALVLAAPVQAHELTQKKAKNALKPIAAELVGTAGPAIAAKLPGATISKSSVEACQISKSKHRAICAIVFSIQGASIAETECGLDALVKFKSAKSKQLKIAIGDTIACFFPVPLQ